MNRTIAEKNIPDNPELKSYKENNPAQPMLTGEYTKGG